jgi:hypothetical protein
MRRNVWVRVALGAFVLLIAGSAAAVALSPKSSTAGPTRRDVVFYSGKEQDGAQRARKDTGWQLVAKKGAEFDTYSTGTGDCLPTYGSNFPDGMTTLVGWSLGRIGPLYFIEDPGSHANEINTIYLFDPGVEDEFRDNCDTRNGRNPGALLAGWLAVDSSRTVVFVTGAGSNVDGLAGLRKYYLAGITGTPLAHQTLLCTSNVAHDESKFLPAFLKQVIPHPQSCPDGSEKQALDDGIPSVIPVAPDELAPPISVEPLPAQPDLSVAAPEPAPSIQVAPPSPATPPAPAPNIQPAAPVPTTSKSTPPPPPSAVGTVNGCNTYGGYCENNPAFTTVPPPGTTVAQFIAWPRATSVPNGAQLTATCWTTGVLVWNYAAQHNPIDYGPNPYESDVYYRVSANGTSGYIPDTYFVRDKNGHLGLPHC